MTARWLAFVMWAAVAASAVFWGFRLLARALPAPAHTTTVSTAAAVRGDLARLLGTDARPAVAADEAAPAPDTRFQLVGVVSPRARQSAGEGLALIAVDGKPARAYRVGAAVEGDTVLQSVSARGAALGPMGAPATVALEIPALPPPATGTMPGALPAPAAPVPAWPQPSPAVRQAPALPPSALGAAAAGLRQRSDPDPPPAPPQ